MTITVSLKLTPSSLNVVFTSKHSENFVSRWRERSNAGDCIHEEKINFEGFPENGCYGNQPQPFEVLFDSIDANNSCSFTKQDLILKQAYLVGFCFVLFNKLKFLQLVLVFSALYRL